MVAISVPTSPMKADNSMETVCENATKWLFMACDKLCIHQEMIALVRGDVEFLKRGIGKFKMKLCKLILKDLCLQIQVILLKTPMKI